MSDPVPSLTTPASPALVTVQTPKGSVYIQGHSSPAFIANLTVDSGIGAFHGYSGNSPEAQKETLLKLAAREGTNVVIAYDDDQRIVGYLGISYPDAKERWGTLGIDCICELGAVEVSRHWRGLGLARQIMAAALGDPEVEAKIVISTTYAWHWDLTETGLNKWQYRDLLLKLHKAFGFTDLPTNEPNVGLDPANLLLVRVGSRVAPVASSQFYSALFSCAPDDSWCEI